MKKTFIKTIFKDLKHNISRFIAIIAIVALGVGFLIGLLSATPDLQASMASYYEKEVMSDLTIKSPIDQFAEKEVEAIVNLDTVEAVEGSYETDCKAVYNSNDLIARVIETSFNRSVTKLKLKNGRFPQNNNECIVLARNSFASQKVIGKTITLNTKEYTIVGTCLSPQYYYKLQEYTTISDDGLDIIIYKLLEKNYYNTLAVKIKGTPIKSVFKQKYFDYLKPYEEELANLSVALEGEREAILLAKIKEQLEENSIPLPPGIDLEQLLKQELDKYNLNWYILNLKSNVSYMAYFNNSKKVDDVAFVFPFFFFFIAALIALTSITRIVSEDRSSIGTLKSLGYGNHTILNKYVFYAFFACAIGITLGIVSGVYILPIVIYNCYNSLFILPVGNYEWNVVIILVSGLSMLITVFMVMIAVCLKTLHERPNELMVAKSPKAGKKILLERVGIIWKHLQFRFKSAIRNIFRFKRNLIMMIVGIGGCTGLMLVAFGLRDSISSLSAKQYDEIIKYDLALKFNSDFSVENYFKDSSFSYCTSYIGKMTKNSDYEAHVYYTSDKKFADYINIGSNQLNKDSVIISKQLAEKLNYKVGSKLTVEVEVKDSLTEKREYEVTSIFENYISNYIIIYEEGLSYNCALVKLGTHDKSEKKAILGQLNEFCDIENKDITRQTYASMNDSIGLIILVITLCCGALAIIVIFNLTNININERLKEIATLKVLGYHLHEVLGYIFREIVLMSLLGIIFGFIIGPLLNYFVMDRISSAGTYFAPQIAWYNYIYAFLMTLVFVLIVILLFIRKLKNIKMVESLKCVE